MKLLGAGHDLKVGGQFDVGQHRSLLVIPGGERFMYTNGVLRQRIYQEPSNAGGRFIAAGAFVSDALKLGNRWTVSAGLRFDHVRAISQGIDQLDADGNETGVFLDGRGTLYTWNIFSPRFGVIVKLDATGRTLLRASYGRFSQGILTGEVSPFHAGQSIVRGTTIGDGTVIGTVPVTDPSIQDFDPGTRPPRTDEFSIGLDRELGGQTAVAVTYVRKDGRNFIAWKNLNGVYIDKDELGRWSHPGGPQSRCERHADTGSAVSVDQPPGVVADVRRPRRGRRETALTRLAGVWLLHVVEGVRAAAVQRNDRRRRPGRDGGRSAGQLQQATPVRARSE